MIARAVAPARRSTLLEPGRTIIAHAGILMTRVQYTKPIAARRLWWWTRRTICSARRSMVPSIPLPVSLVRKNPAARVDIVGPVCKRRCFLRDWPLGGVQPGDVLAIWAAGAYGMSLASSSTRAVDPRSSGGRQASPHHPSSRIRKRSCAATFSPKANQSARDMNFGVQQRNPDGCHCSPSDQDGRNLNINAIRIAVGTSRSCLAPLQLVPQNFIVRLPMRLDQFQPFLRPHDRHAVFRLHQHAFLSIQGQIHRLRHSA